MGGRWSWKIEGTGEEGCRVVCGGGEVCGMRGAEIDVKIDVRSGEGRDWPGRGERHLA